MSINANITRVISASAGAGAVQSGSFSKLYIIETAVFGKINFGTSHNTKFIDSYGQPGTKLEVSNIFNTAVSVKATAGTYIDGPIASFELASGGCLAYDTLGKG